MKGVIESYGKFIITLIIASALVVFLFVVFNNVPEDNVNLSNESVHTVVSKGEPIIVCNDCIEVEQGNLNYDFTSVHLSVHPFNLETVLTSLFYSI